MNGKLRHSLIACVALAALLFVPQQAPASAGDVIRDCAQDGTLDGNYSQGELQGALNSLPSDLDEYTDCRSVIRNATLSKAGGKRSSQPSASVSGVDSSVPASSKESRQLARAAKAGGAVKIGDELVKPGEAGFLAAAFDSNVPALLIALLVAFVAATLAGAALAAQRRWPDATNSVAAVASRPFKAVGRGVQRGISRFKR